MSPTPFSHLDELSAQVQAQPKPVLEYKLDELCRALHIDEGAAALFHGIADGFEQGFEPEVTRTYEESDDHWAYGLGTYIGACLRTKPQKDQTTEYGKILKARMEGRNEPSNRQAPNFLVQAAAIPPALEGRISVTQAMAEDPTRTLAEAREAAKLQLLRPFDLDKARAGEEVCIYDDASNAVHFVGVSVSGEIVCEHVSSPYTDFCTVPESNLRMQPIFWLDGKPVYKGDRLYRANLNYSHCNGQPVIVIGPNSLTDDGCTVLYENEDRKEGATAEYLSWTKPERKIQIGNRTVNAPEVEAPAEGTEYYAPYTHSVFGVLTCIWDGNRHNLSHLNTGHVFLKKEDALAASAAIITLMTGNEGFTFEASSESD